MFAYLAEFIHLSHITSHIVIRFEDLPNLSLCRFVFLWSLPVHGHQGALCQGGCHDDVQLAIVEQNLKCSSILSKYGIQKEKQGANSGTEGEPASDRGTWALQSVSQEARLADLRLTAFQVTTHTNNLKELCSCLRQGILSSFVNHSQQPSVSQKISKEAFPDSVQHWSLQSSVWPEWSPLVESSNWISVCMLFLFWWCYLLKRFTQI